jgi:hypothetical protein
MKFRWTESLRLVTVGLLAAGEAGAVIPMHHCNSSEDGSTWKTQLAGGENV